MIRHKHFLDERRMVHEKGRLTGQRKRDDIAVGGQRL
jgi:hypothetical protein